ncbi:MAG: hypothetical protein GY861_21080 [bacterium]|nr:hypothetical protein [bacterium]
MNQMCCNCKWWCAGDGNFHWNKLGFCKELIVSRKYDGGGKCVLFHEVGVARGRSYWLQPNEKLTSPVVFINGSWRSRSIVIEEIRDKSAFNIAKYYKLSISRMCMILEEYGLPYTYSSFECFKEILNFVDVFKNLGLTVTEFCDYFGIHQSYVTLARGVVWKRAPYVSIFVNKKRNECRLSIPRVLSNAFDIEEPVIACHVESAIRAYAIKFYVYVGAGDYSIRLYNVSSAGGKYTSYKMQFTKAAKMYLRVIGSMNRIPVRIGPQSFSFEVDRIR